MLMSQSHIISTSNLDCRRVYGYEVEMEEHNVISRNTLHKFYDGKYSYVSVLYGSCAETFRPCCEGFIVAETLMLP